MIRPKRNEAHKSRLENLMWLISPNVATSVASGEIPLLFLRGNEPTQLSSLSLCVKLSQWYLEADEQTVNRSNKVRNKVISY